MKNSKVISAPNKTLIKSTNQFPVVGIGASAGGLDAFKKFLTAIPENSGIAYVLVQHLDPNHDSLLPELLQKVTSIPVLEILDNVKILPNHIYTIPSNKMLIANDGKLELSPRITTKTERNLPIDLFFTSLAEVHQSHAIGVVLSGTASDGTQGLKAIKAEGGITFAQDEASAAFEGMPQSAARADVVDFILPPEKIVEKLLEVTNIIYSNKSEEHDILPSEQDIFRQILSLLRMRSGTDFTHYKQTTIQRRILRRMALSKSEDPSTYLQYLRENKQEQDILYQDLLIPVTEFFRDKKIFDNLCETAFPSIIKNKPNGEPFRIWVAGCSTGEEAFSLAICFKEFLGDTNDKIQIFATDISVPAINRARAGIYKKSSLENVSPKRLNEFFAPYDGGYLLNKAVRDMCVFATHNFLKDPPFGKMDFISCRNVLIYMEPYLQKKALTTFHYALKPKGFLLLGKSETISSVPDLFATAVKSDKLFSPKDVPGKFMHVSMQPSEHKLQSKNANAKTESIATDFQKAADEVIRNKYMPAGVVVNEVFDIVNFRGKTNDYLEQLPGKPSLNLLKLAKPGLAFELRNILHKAKKENIAVAKENISIHETLPAGETGSIQLLVSIEAIPLNTIEPHYLILFTPSSHPKPKIRKTSSRSKISDKDERIQQLERQLLQTHEDMRSITEEQEAANEELQSANEELLSSSEELQSLNEEQETSKEELQSTNEELTVVNQEMNSLIELLAEARDYAEALVTTVHDSMIVLDKNLRVKTANKSFYKLFRVTEKETEGELIYNLGNRQWNIARLREFLEDIIPKNSHFYDFEVSHNFPKIGEKVMRLNASRLIQKQNSEQLILLTINDITELEIARKKIRDEQKIREEEKDSFISIASHELKTPLTTAKAYLQMLELELGESGEDAKLYAKKASHSINRLSELISELLDVSKIRLGKLNYTITTFNFNEMVERTIENVQLTSDTHTIIKTGEVIDEVTGDKNRLEQVFINLLNNAIKYSPDSKEVYVTVLQEGNMIKVSVRDKGIGIVTQSLDKIFEKYHRIAEHETHFQGLGIGLFISYEIIQRHHGELWVESIPGKGSTFYFTLPVSRNNHQ